MGERGFFDAGEIVDLGREIGILVSFEGAAFMYAMATTWSRTEVMIALSFLWLRVR